tara:strand:- start:117 stop:356 length:240 start_codon:yes stop_codon:yes gene_type:complete
VNIDIEKDIKENPIIKHMMQDLSEDEVKEFLESMGPFFESLSETMNLFETNLKNDGYFEKIMEAIDKMTEEDLPWQGKS